MRNGFKALCFTSLLFLSTGCYSEMSGSGGGQAGTGGSGGSENAGTGGSVTGGSSGGSTAGSSGFAGSGIGGGIAGTGEAGTGGTGGAEAGAGAGAGGGNAGSSGEGVPCGPVTCAPGLVCCNASCGTCTLPGQGCTAIACVDAGPPGIECGDGVCAADQICCEQCPGEDPVCQAASTAGCPDIVCPAVDCWGDADCPPGSYCAKQKGECLAEGICEPIASGVICTADCPGVCGCDGEFYCNECMALGAGVNVANQGACDCAAQDAVGEGDCDAFFGWAWNGSECLGISGCGCVGADCSATFDDPEACRSAFQACLTDDCRKNGCPEAHYCGMCWVGYSCIPDGAVC